MDWFLYDIGLCHEGVNAILRNKQLLLIDSIVYLPAINIPGASMATIQGMLCQKQPPEVFSKKRCS